MSLPFQQLQPPPPPLYVESYRSHGGSVGPVIAVLAVIMVLGVIAGIVGRLCSGRTIMGYGHYDLEGWFERRCAPCIDGRLEAPTPRPRAPGTGGGAAAEAGGAAGPETPAEGRGIVN
ncbi:unnamed protein product [Musa acuminata subsp. burmannicoides]